ncbi:hypothetical protein [uncultured Ruminococcus sp.]|uniref:hypothetical protein n=1 Tax=uncultured Ruminococcus sp. TaxID=165186 RepID=UPI0026091AEF|nr:hypothetical protein [uncultured Ruminococcus sp.]
MGLFSFFQGGAKYFDKKIDPKCDYCTYGKRTKDGNRVLCEKRGLVEQNYSCKAFIYSPLKRIPVKQLRFVGSIADDDLYIESKGDRTEKEAAEKKAKEEAAPKPNTEAPVQAEAPAPAPEAAPAPAPAEAPVQENIQQEAQEISSLAEAAKAAEEALAANAQTE